MTLQDLRLGLSPHLSHHRMSSRNEDAAARAPFASCGVRDTRDDCMTPLHEKQHRLVGSVPVQGMTNSDTTWGEWENTNTSTEGACCFL
jgi:hypothetical protein